MKGTLSQQLLQKGITWDQLGLKQDTQAQSNGDDSKLKQSSTTSTTNIKQSNNINNGFQADTKKNNKNNIQPNSKEPSSDIIKEQKNPIMLSNLVYSKISDVATAHKVNSQSTQQAALLTPQNLKVNIKNDVNQNSDVQYKKDESIFKKPQLYLQENNHETNIQIITDNNQDNNHDNIESARLTTTQSELKQQYYNNNSTKNGDSTPINPTQIFASSPRAQYTQDRIQQSTEILTDTHLSSSSSKNTSKQSSDRLFFLQLPKAKNTINQPSSNNGNSATKAENHLNSCQVTKSNQQLSPTKLTQAKIGQFAKERIYSFQQTRANTAHNTPQNLNKNTLKEYQDQDELFPSQPSQISSSSSSKYSQAQNNIEKHQQVPKITSDFSSQNNQPIKKQRNLTINQHSFSNTQHIQPVQHHPRQVNYSTKHSPSSSVQFQQHNHQINYPYAGLHQQQHSMDLNSFAQEQYQRKMIAKTQFTCPTQSSQTSLQTFPVEQPNQQDYFSVFSSENNFNFHHKNAGSANKQNIYSEQPTTMEATQHPTSSQVFNQNYISKITELTPQGHYSQNNHQWKYDVSENLQPISNISAHKHANSSVVAVKQSTKQFDSPCLFPKKKTDNQSCTNTNSKQVITRSDKIQTLDNINEYESEKKIQLPSKINNFNSNEILQNSSKQVSLSQQKPYLNSESPSTSFSQSSKKRESYSNETLLSPPKNSKENQQQFERILSAIQTSGNPVLLSELTNLYSSIFNLPEGYQKELAGENDYSDINNSHKSDSKLRKGSEQLDIKNHSSGGYYSSNKKPPKYQNINTETLGFDSNTPNKSNNVSENTNKNLVIDHNNKPKNNVSTSSSSLEDKQNIQLADMNHKINKKDEEEREEFLREEERIALSQTILLAQYIDFSKEEFVKIVREFYASRNQTIPEAHQLKDLSVTVFELLELQKWMTAKLVDRLDEEKKARLKTEEQTSQMLLNQEKTIKVMESKWHSQLEQLQRTKSLSVSGKNAENQLLYMHSGTLPNFEAEDF